MKIEAFDIFDVDIRDAWRRQPKGGWEPKEQARRILNEFDKTETRLVGTFRPPEGLTRVFEILATSIPQVNDPYGRIERERLVNISNEQIQNGNYGGYTLSKEYEDFWSDVLPLQPKAIYEIVYPVRLVGKTPIYSPYFVQRISLDFPDNHAALAAKIILDPLDKS